MLLSLYQQQIMESPVQIELVRSLTYFACTTNTADMDSGVIHK